MSGCLAMTKDKKACRNYADLGSITCHQHRNFFQKDLSRLFFRNGFGNFLHLRPDGIKYRVEECLKRGLLQITKEQVMAINPRIHTSVTRSWCYFALVSNRYNNVMKSNPVLWKAIIRQLWAWTEKITIGPTLITWADMREMICVKGNCAEFYEGVALFPDEAAYRHVMNEEEWFKFFETLDPGFIVELWTTEYQSRDPIFGDRWRAWLQQKKETFLSGSHMNSELKEELFAVAYHPSRAVAWTFTEEEKQELLQLKN